MKKTLSRLGIGLAFFMLVLLSVAVQGQEDPLGKVCALCCILLHAHPDESERGACIKRCLETGVCAPSPVTTP
jgi:hypothetical protein